MAENSGVDVKCGKEKSKQKVTVNSCDYTFFSPHSLAAYYDLLLYVPVGLSLAEPGLVHLANTHVFESSTSCCLAA